MLTVPLLLSASQLSTVAIDLPDDAAPATLRRVVQSCNQALGGPRCEALTESSNTTLVAIVRWEGPELRISLRKEHVNGEQVDHREVAFSEEDAPQDRFITAGLMVAALTAAQVTVPEPSVPEAPKIPPPPPRPRPPPAPPPAPERVLPMSHVLVDLTGQLGPGLDGSGLRFGGGARASWLLRTTRVGATAQVNYLRASTPARLRWGSGSLGLITRATRWGSFVGVEVLGEGVMEHVEGQISFGGENQTRKLWRFGGRLTTSFSLKTGVWVEPLLSLQLTLLDRGFRVKFQSEPIASEPPVRLLGLLGLRLGPF